MARCGAAWSLVLRQRASWEHLLFVFEEEQIDCWKKRKKNEEELLRSRRLRVSRFGFCFVFLREVRLFVHISTIFIHFFHSFSFILFNIKIMAKAETKTGREESNCVRKTGRAAKKEWTWCRRRGRCCRMMFSSVARYPPGWLLGIIVVFFGILNYIMIHRADETIHHHAAMLLTTLSPLRKTSPPNNTRRNKSS